MRRGRTMNGHVASIFAFLVASAAGLASAQPRAPSELRVEGTALARGVTIQLDCGRRGQHVRCEVGQRFELSAGGLGLVLTQLGPRNATPRCGSGWRSRATCSA